MEKKTTQPWLLLLLIALLGAGLIFAALALLWSAGGKPGIVLTVLWCVPVSAVLAATVFFARKQQKEGFLPAFLVVEAVALLGAAALTFVIR